MCEVGSLTVRRLLRGPHLSSLSNQFKTAVLNGTQTLLDATPGPSCAPGALTKREARHHAEAVPEAHKLVVAAGQLEEGEDRAAQQQEDVDEEHGKVEELARRDDKHLQIERVGSGVAAAGCDAYELARKAAESRACVAATNARR